MSTLLLDKNNQNQKNARTHVQTFRTDISNTVSSLITRLSALSQNNGSIVSTNGPNITGDSGNSITISSLKSMLSGLSITTASSLVLDVEEEEFQNNAKTVSAGPITRQSK